MATATSITTVRRWAAAAAVAPGPGSASSFGAGHRHLVQHLSFVRRGAQPGRDMMLRLASALDLPLRDRDAALMAAGYAPLYGGPPRLAGDGARGAAVEFMLRQREPSPWSSPIASPTCSAAARPPSGS